MTMKCPTCKETGGEYNEVLWKGLGGGEWIDCWCEGGMVTFLQWLHYHLTNFLDRWLL